jgi:hypothetical protein
VKKGIGAEIAFAQPPDDWKPPQPKVNLGEPNFGIVDKPNHWAEFTYHPVFASKKKTGKKDSHHALATGATPVPTDKSRDQTVAINKTKQTNSL